MKPQEKPNVTETHLALARSIEIWIRQDGVSAEFIAGQLAELTAVSEKGLVDSAAEVRRLREESAESIKNAADIMAANHRQIAVIQRMREEATANSALIDELREACQQAALSDSNIAQATDDQLRDAVANGSDEVKKGALAVLALRRALARTPADAGAEVARLREELKCREKDLLAYSLDWNKTLAQLATAEAQLASRDAEYMRGAKMLADNATVWKERAENAEARAKDLGDKCDEWTRLYAEQAARLRAVTEAGDLMREWMMNEIEAEYPAGYIPEAIKHYDAAKSGDLPQSPADTIRVYKNTPEWSAYLSARFPASGTSSKSFEFNGHRWSYQHSSFDDAGDFDLLWRPLSFGDLPPLWHGKLVRVGTFEQGGETITGFICATTREYLEGIGRLPMYKQIAVAGDLPPHPDTVRLDWLERTHSGTAFEDHETALSGFVITGEQSGITGRAYSLRAAIDAAIQSAKEDGK